MWRKNSGTFLVAFLFFLFFSILQSPTSLQALTIEELSSLQQVKLAYENQLIALQTRIDTLTKALNLSETLSVKQSPEFQALQKELEALKEEWTVTKEALTSLRKQYNSLLSQSDNYKVQLTDTVQSMDNLQNSFNDYRKSTETQLKILKLSKTVTFTIGFATGAGVLYGGYQLYKWVRAQF